MMRPLAPKTTVPMSIQRMRLAVSTSWVGLKPGANTWRTRGSATSAASATSTTSSSVIRFSTRLKSSHASRLFALDPVGAEGGDNALAKAPPATSWNSRSGMRNAAR